MWFTNFFHNIKFQAWVHWIAESRLFYYVGVNFFSLLYSIWICIGLLSFFSDQAFLTKSTPCKKYRISHHSYFLIYAGILEQSIRVSNRVGIGLSYRPTRARICKRLRIPEIDSASLCSHGGFRTGPPGWESNPGHLGRFTNTGLRQHRLANRFLTYLKSLKIPSPGLGRRPVRAIVVSPTTALFPSRQSIIP